MGIRFLQRSSLLRALFYEASKPRADNVVGRIKRALKRGDRILDIGAGTCNVCEVLLQDGYEVTPLDVKDLSLVSTVTPLVYDGDKIPFGDDSFDVALLLTVLHHVPWPEKTVREARRVAKRIIIIEDIYENSFQKYLIYFLDSVLNLEFGGHPHTNKTDRQWKEMFEKLTLKITEIKYDVSLLGFKQALYCLEK